MNLIPWGKRSDRTELGHPINSLRSAKRGQYDHDSNFIGRINELRIYDVALSDGWIWASFEAGPDILPEVPIDPPAEPNDPDTSTGR